MRPSTPIPLLLSLLLLLAACAAPPPSPAAPVSPAPTKTRFVFPPTFTPAPPTATSIPISPTPRPTRTPTPTSSPAPTLPPLPTAYPPVQSATADDQPPRAYHLLFLAGGELKLWNRDTGQIEDLIPFDDPAERVNRVQAYSISADRLRVALLRKDASGGWELAVFDRLAGQMLWRQSLESAQVADFAISPNGLWVAYIAPQDVIVVPLEAPERAATVGQCAPACAGLLWKPGSLFLVWGDQTGVWQIDPALGVDQNAELLLEPFVQAITARGENVYGSYAPLNWSPSGRFLLLGKGLAEERPLVVLDTASGRAEELAGPFLYVDARLSLAWLQGDLLLITRAALPGQAVRAAGEVLQIDPATEDFFVQVNQFSVGESPADVPFAPHQLADGRLAFAMLNFSTPNFVETNGIYVFDFVNPPLKSNDLPFGPLRDVVWTPDGSAGLVVTARRTLYVPADGGQIYDLRLFLGVSACCFTWIP